MQHAFLLVEKLSDFVSPEKSICDVNAQTSQNNQALQNMVQKQIMKYCFIT
jgi:hypothetical protein